MAALRMREDTAGRLTMQSPLLPQFGNLLSMIVWVAVLAFFIFPSFGGDQVNWSDLLLILFFFLATAGSSVLGSLLRTVVTVDRTTRTISSTQRLLNIPIRSTELTFNDLESIINEYYRQSSGRSTHDAWRVTAVARDGRRLLLNWDGKREEMADLASRLSYQTGASLVDNAEKTVSTAQPTMGRLDGEREETEMPGSGAWQDEEETPVPDTSPSDHSEIPSAIPASPSMEAAESNTGYAKSIWQLAASELERRIASDSLDSDARYALARRHQAQGQLDKAIEWYQKAMALDPANAGIQNDMGVALQLRGKRGEAETAYRRAVALDPFSSTAHLNLGLLLRSMNRASDASQEFLLARRNARGDAETRSAETASLNNKMEPRLTSL